MSYVPKNFVAVPTKPAVAVSKEVVYNVHYRDTKGKHHTQRVAFPDDLSNHHDAILCVQEALINESQAWMEPMLAVPQGE